MPRLRLQRAHAPEVAGKRGLGRGALQDDPLVRTELLLQLPLPLSLLPPLVVLVLMPVLVLLLPPLLTVPPSPLQVGPAAPVRRYIRILHSPLAFIPKLSLALVAHPAVYSLQVCALKISGSAPAR